LAFAESFLERIAALDSQLDAFICVTADLAREQARQEQQDIARGQYHGSLHGIPVATGIPYSRSKKSISNAYRAVVAGRWWGCNGRQAVRGE
jgi:hypothetical protein